MARALRCLFLAALVTAGSVFIGAVISPANSVPHEARPRTRVVTVAAGTAPVRLESPATHLAVRWHGGEDGQVEVRSSGTGGWSAWHPMALAHDLDDEERQIRSSGLIRIDGASLLQARSRGPVRRLELVIIDASRGPDAAALPVAEPGAGPPPVITRAGWGADEGMRKGDPKHAPVSKLVVHHSVTPNDDPDPASTVRAIYAFHTRSRGWDDIGYNFVVDQQGRVYEGRFARAYAPGETPTGEDRAGRGVIGAHAKGFNQGSAGITLLGDFSGGFHPPAPQVDALTSVLAWKARDRNIAAEGNDEFTSSDGRKRRFPNISGHRDVGQTACPGDRLYEKLPEIRRRVATLAPNGSPPAAPPAEPPPLPPPPPIPPAPGYWLAAGDGRVHPFGDAPAQGDLGANPPVAPIVALAATPRRDGYWLAGADGGVFAFGNARFAGSAAGRLISPAVHLEPTGTGRGYWLVSATGEVAAFGDATFLGPAGGMPFPVVGMASTPSGRGYWLAAADGRVLAFGDAVSRSRDRMTGEIGGVAPPGARIAGIAGHPSGRGYWLLGEDGGVFAVGAPFHGSVPERRAGVRAVQIRPTDSGSGYYVAGDDGSVFAFGDADPRRERPGTPGDRTTVDLALRPSPDGRPAPESESQAAAGERAVPAAG